MLLEKTAIWLNWQVGHWPNPKLRMGLGRELALPLALGIAVELDFVRVGEEEGPPEVGVLLESELKLREGGGVWLSLREGG